MKKIYSTPAVFKMAVFFAAGLTLSSQVGAQQVFSPQSGASNPLNGIDIGQFATPVFVDADGDGDADLLSGNVDGTIAFYRNTGTAANPVFTAQTGPANPFGTIDVSDFSAPMFVDIDGDGDRDLISGEIYGSLKFYRNTGTSAAPVFVEQTGAASPFTGFFTGNFSKPAFADIDADGDLDLYVGETTGTVSFYRNTGTASAPVFVSQPSGINSVTNFAYPTFTDFNGDGDLDLIVGAGNGSISYFQNNGTRFAPAFVQQTGAANPFALLATGTYASPAFVDLRADGLIDVVVGTQDGTFSYLQNTSALPLQLVSFTGASQGAFNQLQWQTAQEVNTRAFDVEASKDGISFAKVTSIAASGSGNHSYAARDAAATGARTYYRLKMIDADGRFTYSQIIWISSEARVEVSLYPNPVGNVMNLNIGSAKLLKTKAGIFDAVGRLQQNISIENQQQQVNVQGLTRGTYIIKFANGTSQSFTKN